MERLGQRAKRTGNMSAGLVDQHIDQTNSKIRKVEKKISNRNKKLLEIYDWNKELTCRQLIQKLRLDGLADSHIEHMNAMIDAIELLNKISELSDKRVKDLIITFSRILGKEIAVRDAEIKRLDTRLNDLYRKL